MKFSTTVLFATVCAIAAATPIPFDDQSQANGDTGGVGGGGANGGNGGDGLLIGGNGGDAGSGGNAGGNNGTSQNGDGGVPDNKGPLNKIVNGLLGPPPS